jgi:hypothetical protein
MIMIFDDVDGFVLESLQLLARTMEDIASRIIGTLMFVLS